MKITILGCNGPFPGSKGACSSYLISSGDVNVIVDTGCGSLSNMLKTIEPGSVDAVILSHLHWDHISDIFVLGYYLKISKKSKGMPVKLYLPRTPENVYELIAGITAFDVHILDGRFEYVKEGMRITSMAMPHPVESYALKFKADGRTLVYSGDTTYNKGLVEFASGCDLLIADSGFLERQRSESSPHMSALQCAKTAVEAGAGRLMLSHLNPDTVADLYLKEACDIFPDTVTAIAMNETEV